MNRPSSTLRLALLTTVLFVVAACQDASGPIDPPDEARTSAGAAGPPEGVPAWFVRATPEVLALPRTVFADHDEAANVLVFGVEHPGAANGVRNVMARLGIPADAYRIEVAQPIHFVATLRDRHRPTIGGIQIHFSNFLCTLGFNVDHAGGRSFITNSHCTDQQGSNDGTVYYQPVSSVDPVAIATEAHDPSYTRGGGCPRGRVCRSSDASRALYDGGTASTRGALARTSGANSGSLEVVGTFNVASQNNTSTSFSGTINKVGRTTGWTSGTVSNTCATVNVSGTNITLLCQTLVSSNQQIVGGGDSGSPVFTTGSSSDVTLVGILWGGSSSGDLFVFSPLKNIQDELGAMTATSGGSAPPPDDPPDEDPPCTPRGKSGNCH